jgi:glyoxylase-like metal-dependent hydrolase (beta-lactamase superfamily II)
VNTADPRAARRPRPGADLSYPFPAPSTDGAVVEVAPGVLWVRMPMPMALDHINVWLLRGDTGWTIVDTGLATEQTKALWEHIVAHHLDGLPVEALVCTHFHYDHAGLASWITERFGVPLYMTLAEFFTMRVLEGAMTDPPPPEQVEFYARAGLPAERTARLFDALRRDPFMPPRQGQYRRLRDGDVLKIGSRRWRVLVGEGHSPEHACLYCAEDRLLIGGDQLLPRISSNVLVSSFEPDANPLALWLRSLDRLDTCAPDTLVLPSHQSVFRGLHARVQELREHHRHQFDLLHRFVAERVECTAFEAMGALFPRLRGAGDDILALGETLAHLAWLREDGVLQRRLAEDGTWRHALVATTDDAEIHW